MTNKTKKLVSRPKNGNLRIASTAPWMRAKTDTPILEKLPSAANLKLSIDDFRWEKHLESKGKTDELKQKEYTEKQVQAANNTRTWRSDAADVMHGLGEAAFTFNPYTATSYFGGKALDSAFKNGITPETVVNAGFAALPWMHTLAPMILSGVLKGSLFMTSNITGKWTPFFGREYRLNPNIIGMNGGGIQSRPIARYTNIDDLIAQNTAEHLDGTRVAGLHEFARALGSDIQGIVDRVPADGSITFHRSSLLLPGVSGVVRESQPGVMRQLLEQNLEPLVRKGLIPGEPIQANPNAPYRTIDDLIENNTVELEGGLRRAGVRNATRELGYNNTGELLSNVPTNAPVIVNSPIPGTFTLEEAHTGGFRTALEGKQPQLIQRGIIRETVAPKPSSASLNELRGQVVKATDPRVADIPREELAKYGIGLDMSEGGTPYLFSDLFLSPSDPVYGVTLSDFASKDPGAYNVAYWHRLNQPDIVDVAKYYGAKLNRQALADEGRRIQLNNPINISGSFGALKDYDLNVLSYLNAMRNMLKQQKIGRQVVMLDPKLNTHITEHNGYINMNELFQGPRYDDSRVSQEFIEGMRDMFNRGEQTISNAVGQAPTDASALSSFLEKKAGLRGNLLWREGAGSRLIDPSKFLAMKSYGSNGSFQGFKLFLNGRDAGFLRAVPRKEIFDNFMGLFDLLRNLLGLKLADPKMLNDGSFLGPKLTTITLKKGGRLKLIKRRK